jgi:hypothetical protein
MRRTTAFVATAAVALLAAVALGAAGGAVEASQRGGTYPPQPTAPIVTAAGNNRIGEPFIVSANRLCAGSVTFVLSANVTLSSPPVLVSRNGSANYTFANTSAIAPGKYTVSVMQSGCATATTSVTFVVKAGRGQSGSTPNTNTISGGGTGTTSAGGAGSIAGVQAVGAFGLMGAASIGVLRIRRRPRTSLSPG